MLTHIGMFILKDSAEGKSKFENLQQIFKNVEELKANISSIKSITAGGNHEVTGLDFPGYDLAVCVIFENEADYRSYYVHPVHIQAAEFAAKVSKKVAAITYNDSII